MRTQDGTYGGPVAEVPGAELVAFGTSGGHGLSRRGLIASRGGREVCAVKS